MKKPPQTNKLTAQQIQFAHEYMIDLNGKQAAIRAGYTPKSADVQASYLLTIPKVRRLVNELKKQRISTTKITAERVLKEIERLAFVDSSEVAKYKIKRPEDLAKLPEDIRRAIVGWKWDKWGQLIITFADKKGSLELYGRHLKLFTDNMNHTGVIPVKLVDDVK